MLEAGFEPDFSDAVLRQVTTAVAVSPTISRVDMRDLLWSSIDNPTSRDLDQIEFVERKSNGELTIRLGIADVDAFVPKGSPADLRAAQNGFSIYLGVVTFPMLPPQLSYDLTSLLPDKIREAVVFDITLDADDRIGPAAVALAEVRNRAQLNYESIGAWLEQSTNVPPILANTPGLVDQLKLQQEVAQRLHAQRFRAGALEFESIEPQPVMSGGDITGLALQRKNRARDLIEDLMIAANRAIAAFLQAHGCPSIQRVIPTPERWPRIVELASQHGGRLPDEADAVELEKFLSSQRRKDPARFPDLSLAIVKLIGPAEYVVVRDKNDATGHFSLAVDDYTHSTAPNRRYPDLIVQRLLKAAVTNQPCPYSIEELEEIATRCNDRAKAARNIERLMRKVVAATFLRNRIGQTFTGIVTGATERGTFVRISDPPAEGKIVRGEAGLDVGDSVRVKLIATTPKKGFIDFARSG